MTAKTEPETYAVDGSKPGWKVTKTAPLKMLTREDILKGPALATEVVEVPEWGGTVTVRALSGAARDKYEADLMKFAPDGKMAGFNVEGKRARMVSLAVVGPDGKPMFRPADILALGDQDAQAMDRVVSVAFRLSGMAEEAAEKAKEGFTPDPSSSSGTG